MRIRRSDVSKTARRRLEVRQTLRRYPHLPASAIEDLVHWFEREATVHEVAAVTRQLEAHDSFDQFRRAHIAKVNPVLRLGAAVAVMALIVSLGMGLAAL